MENRLSNKYLWGRSRKKSDKPGNLKSKIKLPSESDPQPTKEAALIRVIAKMDQNCYNPIVLRKNRLIIGRDTDCDYQITSVEISRIHTAIVFQESEWFIIDINSTNGVYVNGTLVESVARLSDNCLISFGPLYTSTFRYVFVQNYEDYNNIGNKTEETVNAPQVIDNALYIQSSRRFESLKKENMNLNESLEKIKKTILVYKKQMKSSEEQMVEAEKKLKEKEQELNQVSETVHKSKERHQNLLKIFEQQQLNKEKDTDILFKNIILNELLCSICCEIMNEPTTLNCQHTFCLFCIEKWEKRSFSCPVCRIRIVSQNRSMVFDSCIKVILDHYLTKEELKERKLTIEAKMKDPILTSVRSIEGNSTINSVNVSTTSNNNDTFHESDMDTINENESRDFMYNPTTNNNTSGTNNNSVNENTRRFLDRLNSYPSLRDGGVFFSPVRRERNSVASLLVPRIRRDFERSTPLNRNVEISYYRNIPPITRRTTNVSVEAALDSQARSHRYNLRSR